MKILAFEFSSSQRSVAAVWSGDGPLNRNRNASSLEDDAHSTAAGIRESEGTRGLPTDYQFAETISGKADALAMADEVLREARWEREQVECIAVGLGPGSYTGIRAAIALAQGWQLARGTTVAGISSAEVLAAHAHAERLRGSIGVVIDAQRNEFYVERYELSETGPRRIEPLRLASLETVKGCESSGDLLAGPDVTRWFPSGQVVFPRAATLGGLALHLRNFATAESLEPIYLRETNFVKARPFRG